jgi:hypothetical protein
MTTSIEAILSDGCKTGKKAASNQAKFGSISSDASRRECTSAYASSNKRSLFTAKTVNTEPYNISDCFGVHTISNGLDGSVQKLEVRHTTNFWVAQEQNATTAASD